MNEAYRSYVADSLRAIPQGAYIRTRWVEIFAPKPEIDADAIIENLVDKLGGEE